VFVEKDKRIKSGLSSSGAHLKSEEIHLEEIQYNALKHHWKRKVKDIETYLEKICFVAENEREVRNNKEKI
jgi:hypothetical protein